MADIDIDPFGEHESRTEEPTDENIPLTPVTPGRSTWEPEREHEMSFGSSEVPLSKGEILHKEALLPGGAAMVSGGGEPPPKDEKGLKEWVRSKLKVLASLLGRLGMKAAEALPGIIGGITSWILNRAKDVVGWVSQNLSALVVGTGGLIHMYMVTR